ncbi:MAG: NUDIX domain-containing protein [Pirellulales bacterium]|nr:NUDIX domain-containing protein [Pirellulales bacterium]
MEASVISREVAIAVIVRQNCVLVGERPPHASFAGYAEFPGGKVEPGETPDVAAVRETEEESGLKVRVMRILDTAESPTPRGTLRLWFFLCELQDPDQHPAPPWHWVPRPLLAELKFPPANAPLLRFLTQGECLITGTR